MIEADRVHSTPPTNTSSTLDANPSREAPAESVDSFSHQPAIRQPKSGKLTSGFPEPAQEPLPNATILALRPRAVNLPVQRPENEGLSPWKAGSEREEASDIIKAAVTYCCSKATGEPGFIADHTRNCVFAGGIVGHKYRREADRSMRKLVKLMDASSGLMTVELWSLASVAGFVLKQTEVAEELIEEEIAYLKSFAQLVERVCKDQYHREIKAES